MTSETDKALLMTVSCALAHRTLLAGNSSNSMTSWVMPLAFAAKYTLFNKIHSFSCIYCCRVLFGSHENTLQTRRFIGSHS